MGTDLSDLLRAASGEGGLSGALGRWREAVSDAIDRVLDPPVRLPDFAQIILALDNPNTAASGVSVFFDPAGTNILQVPSPQGIGILAQGGFSLTGGNLYHLHFHGAFTFAAPAETAVQVDWNDATSGSPLLPAQGSNGLFRNQAAAQLGCDKSLDILFRPTVNQNVIPVGSVLGIVGPVTLRAGAIAWAIQLTR